MDSAERRRLLDQYRDGCRHVTEALHDITEAELDARPGPGRWSARDIVHHLADSEMTGAVRLRLLLASPRPLIAAYDQDEFARRLHYDRPIGPSLAAFTAARTSCADLLERLSDDEWRREGTHSESGPFSVERWLEIYAAHAVRHADQIRAARAAARGGPTR